ncbi:MAG: hypothetical protein U0Q15_08330 [Kineosporiaceae bacterium]
MDAVSAPPARRDPATGRRLTLRRGVNVVTLATPLGLLVAVSGAARIRRGPHGLLLAHGYRWAWPGPGAAAVTIGDVVLLRLDDDELAARPHLLRHEARHAGQYAWCLGPVGFLPAYLAACAWSWWRTRDPLAANVFERRAGFADGGYLGRLERVRARRARPEPGTPPGSGQGL